MNSWRLTLEHMFLRPVDDNPVYGSIRRLLTTTNNALDRLQVVETHKDFVVCTKIPEKCNISIDTCIQDSVDRIRVLNRPLYLLWSGGIDSTTAFYAMLNAGLEFTVVMDEKSRQEYPMLFERIVEGISGVSYIGSFNRVKLNLNQFIIDNPTALFVTGELGDQIFGSNSFFKYTYDERSLSVVEAVNKRLLEVDIYEFCKKSIEKLVGETAYATITLAEFLWAINFVFKYQDVQLRTAVFRLKSQGDDKNCVHFFDTEKWNQYAMSNYMVNNGFKEYAEYKMPLKEYIYSCNGDKSYRDTKLKENSLSVSSYSGVSK